MFFSHKNHGRTNSVVGFAPGVSKFQVMAFRWEQNTDCLNLGFYTIDHIPDEHLPQISSFSVLPQVKKLNFLGYFYSLAGIGLLISFKDTGWLISFVLVLGWFYWVSISFCSDLIL